MLMRVLTAAIAAAFLIGATASPTPTYAAKKKDEAATDAKKDDTKTAEKKALSPQQQKMKDCAAKWGDEKKTKKVSGRKAYNEFMSKCLKG